MTHPLDIAQRPKRAWTDGEWNLAWGLVTVLGRGVIAACPVPQCGGVFECSANGRLIAAAPELFEALELLADYFRQLVPSDPSPDTVWVNDKHCAVWMQARAALSKALGEPS